jgi:hypothetical protein
MGTGRKKSEGTEWPTRALHSTAAITAGDLDSGGWDSNRATVHAASGSKAPPHSPSTVARPPWVDVRIGEGAHGGAGLRRSFSYSGPPWTATGATAFPFARHWENGGRRGMEMKLGLEMWGWWFLLLRHPRLAVGSDWVAPIDRAHIWPRREHARQQIAGPGPGCGLGAERWRAWNGPWATLFWAANA